MPSSFLPVRPRAALGACVALASAVGLELGLRAWSFEYPRAARRRVAWSVERDRELRAGTGLYEPDEHALWRLRAGAVLPWTAGETVAAAGARGPLPAGEREPGALRIAVEGGASALGLGVAWDEAWPARLQEALRATGRPSELLCVAAEEHTLVQGLALWRSRLRAWSPDLLVACFAGEAECVPAPQGRPDEQRLAELALAALRPAETLEDLRVPQLARWLCALASGGYWPERAEELERRRQARGYGAPEWTGTRRVAPEGYERALEELARDCRERGTRLVVLAVPRHPGHERLPVLEQYETRAQAVADREGARFVRARETLKAAVVHEGLVPETLFVGEHALSASGHARLAAALAELVLVEARAVRAEEVR